MQFSILLKKRRTLLASCRAGCIPYLQLLHFVLTVANRMKRKFYSWEECMNLREVKVRTLKKKKAAQCITSQRAN